MINNKSEKYSSKSDGRQMEQSDGRQRLHGAFKGGFSAGYHNTVGSEAGFQPQQYKSNRNEKGSFSQQKLDFMDDEDIQEFGANEFKSDNQFAELGTTERELSRKKMLKAAAQGGFEVSQDIIEVVDNKVGEQLMRAMGHIPGSAIGKQKGRDEALVATSRLLSLKSSKYSAFGLGYDSTANAPEFKKSEKRTESVNDTRNMQDKELSNKGGFGTGIFEDNEDMDDYNQPKVAYSTVLDEEDDYANPFKKKNDIIQMQKTQKPILIKSSKRKGGIIDGFVSIPQMPMPAKIFLAPIPPPGYKPVPPFLNPKFQNLKSTNSSDTADVRPKQLEKNESIFSFISLKNKARLDTFISKASAPAAVPVPKAPLPVYTVPTKVAEAALKGFMPFGADPDKQTRYKTFLQKILDDSKLAVAPEKRELEDAEAHETREFSKAAMIFRPLSDMISSRFTNETGKDKEEEKVLPPVKIVRFTSTWKPSTLLCRRYAVGYVGDNSGGKDKKLAESKQPLNPETMKGLVAERDKLLQRGEINMDMEITAPIEVLTKEDMMNEFMAEKKDGFEEVVEEVVEEKPSMDLFRAIFADSDSSDSEGDTDPGMDIDVQPVAKIAPIAAPKPAMVQPALVIIPPPTAEPKTQPKSILKKTAPVQPDPKVQVDTKVFFKAKSALKMKKAEPKIIPTTEDVEDDELESFKPVFSKRSAAPNPSTTKSESTTKRVGSAFGLGVRKKKQKAIAVVEYSDEDETGNEKL